MVMKKVSTSLSQLLVQCHCCPDFSGKRGVSDLLEGSL